MMLDAAKRYTEMGWSVIPLRPKNKEPVIQWLEFTTRIATTSELSEWFDTGERNLGLVTGALSGFIVVDVDGEEGLATAADLNLRSTTVQLTGKGKQYFYRWDAKYNLKNVVRILPGIDIRSEGGYVCASPSIHPNGKKYVWLQGPTKDLPELPENVAAICANSKNFGATYSRPLLSGKPEGWIGEALKNLAEGNRNATFASVVGKLHHQGLDKTTIWTLLLPHAKSCGFNEQELNRVIQSIMRYPTEGNTVPNSENIEAFLADSSPVAWLCDPVCAKGSIGFTAGLPETYKTWLLMDLAIECARGGGLWLGLFPVMGGRVLFVDQERSREETQRRFKCLLTAKSLSRSSLASSLYVRANTTTRLDIDESYRAFQNYLREIQPDLILIDSFATFQTGDENDRMTVQKVIERIKEIRNEFKCTIIFIDHENKSAYSDGRDNITPSAFRMVGSVGKIAAAEFVLTVRRYDPSTCMVYHTKSTLGPRVPSFAVHVVDTPEGGIHVYGEAGIKT